MTTSQHPDQQEVAYGGVPAGKEHIYSQQPVLQARGLVITFGRVVGLNGVDLDLYPGEILAVIGDNGAGKSTLIKCLTGAFVPDSGEVRLNGQPVAFRKPQDAREAGIETVYQQARRHPCARHREQPVPGSRGAPQGTARLGAAHARQEGHGATGREVGAGPGDPDDPEHEPGRRDPVGWSAAGGGGGARRGVRQQGRHPRRADRGAGRQGVGHGARHDQAGLRDRGLSIIFISHNMPHVWEVADRIHVQRLGGRAGVITPSTHEMGEGVAIMTGAKTLD
ncbi:sugar ABC transporter ATP-binding protein [Angustibacter aerolatus]|uniref:Sugar ABC transporter ATP-binding protein n=1 Tax=Angustibacter aerolatus TaxID=1162965 RepID=A0ABQ6JJ08_9ACTN|nr:ATP-binding cassette domain-containing protein [Angustibacter aerolatus]GMA86852.1 sugar ABC transporter ATP-binding protein [Angustibacter aerolatus]